MARLREVTKWCEVDMGDTPAGASVYKGRCVLFPSLGIPLSCPTLPLKRDIDDSVATPNINTPTKRL